MKVDPGVALTSNVRSCRNEWVIQPPTFVIRSRPASTLPLGDRLTVKLEEAPSCLVNMPAEVARCSVSDRG